MKDLLDIFSSFKDRANDTGIFCDLDGTLSKIAPTPSEATLEDGTRTLLERLSTEYKLVAIVTGRDSDSAARMVDIDDLIYVGNHGLEIYDGISHEIAEEAAEYPKTAAMIASELYASEVLERMDGVLIEQKLLSVAVHYRKAGKEVKPIIEAEVKPVAARYGFKITYGKNVVELKPETGRNKGGAVRDLATRYVLANVVYFGDDITDIDAFDELRSMRQEGIAKTCSVAVSSGEVDRRVVEKANFVIPSIEEMPAMLGHLL